jgi:mono/diheme cytochrome c family protein
MKFYVSFLPVLGLLLSAPAFSPARAQANDLVATAPAYLPDVSHQNEPLPDGVLAWDELLKAADTTNGQDFVHFAFAFTNITDQPVTILSVRPSCGCTTAELPPTPWVIPAGTAGEIKLAVNLAGKAGTVFKKTEVGTDHGKKDLMVRINIAPPPPPRMMSESDRAAAMALAKVDRQAVFKGDCASCHAPKSPNIYGAELYQSVCAICHDSEHRASLVPDLSALKVATSEEFWRTWISIGKPGSVMPAFAQSQGGPLTELQIASLAAYLNMQYPSKAEHAVGQ